MSHEIVARVVCDTCGNRTVGRMTAHDTSCGCPGWVWPSRPAPSRWFEYEPELSGRESAIRTLWPPDPPEPDEIVVVYCDRHGRRRFTVGQAVTVAARVTPGQRPEVVFARR